eukprot:GFKZ01006582.1.p1 GENE.GFKZ01006582.1~~GFKZ01006582.1.p1  ORF type:complete len:453 (+),score=62.30 GFKZ01006582.1:101-1360(+)
MWWTQGVASAIQTCQQQKSVLIILVEPTAAIMNKPPVAEEAPLHMLSRLATTSMHAITFSQPPVRQAIQTANAVCLKFPSDNSNLDFKHFTAFFKLRGTPPNLYFISPVTGETLMLKTGYVSPRSFLDTLVSTTETVSGRKIPMPALETPESSTLALQRLADQIHRDRVEEDAEVKEKAPAPQAAAVPPHPHPEPSPRSLPPTAAATAPTPTKSSTASMTLPSSSPTSKRNSESRLLARFPDGRQLRKTFPASTLFSTVRAWLADEVRKPTNAITIATAFPRHVFDLADNPKMLSELALVPTETLVVVVNSGQRDLSPTEQATATPAVAGIRSYASSALRVVGGFFRSFVADAPEAAEGQNTQWGAAAAPPPAGAARLPGALRMESNRGRRDVAEDDENLLSNGNSTQYGWNPRDEEDE